MVLKASIQTKLNSSVSELMAYQNDILLVPKYIESL